MNSEVVLTVLMREAALKLFYKRYSAFRRKFTDKMNFFLFFAKITRYLERSSFILPF